MATIDSVLTKIRNLISRSNTTTGRTDTDLTNAVNALIGGYMQGGITPYGTLKVTANGIYDCEKYADVEVAVPASGITPSGTKEIESNGTHDVTNFASALVKVQGLNARVFTATVASDVTTTGTTATIMEANDWIKSLRSNPNAFVIVRYLGLTTGVAANAIFILANFVLGYSGSTAYKALLVRQSASTASTAINTNGLTGNNYGGHISVSTTGAITCYVNGSWPLRAGQYQIIAGTVESL